VIVGIPPLGEDRPDAGHMDFKSECPSHSVANLIVIMVHI
jgi:hypothetical protein